MNTQLEMFKMANISGGPISKFKIIKTAIFSNKIVVFDSTTLIYAL